RGAPLTIALVEANCSHWGIDVFAKTKSKHSCILDRHGGALRQVRQHGVGGIAQERGGAFFPRPDGRTVLECPLPPSLRTGQSRAKPPGPRSRREAIKSLAGVAARAPAVLAPIVAYDRHHIDQLAAPHRIVYEMGMATEP